MVSTIMKLCGRTIVDIYKAIFTCFRLNLPLLNSKAVYLISKPLVLLWGYVLYDSKVTYIVLLVENKVFGNAPPPNLPQTGEELDAPS